MMHQSAAAGGHDIAARAVVTRRAALSDKYFRAKVIFGPENRPSRESSPVDPRAVPWKPVKRLRMTSPISRDACAARDKADPLAALRDAFELPEGVIYLDGNSLGPLPRATRARVLQAIEHEWGQGLITSWNDAGWIDLPGRIGGKIARLVGAQADEVIAVDSTSVNLFKLLAGALALRPQRRVIVSETGNFPTDLYIAQGLASLQGAGHELRLVERERIADAIDEHTAVVMLTQVDYRSGSCLDMAAVTALAHRAGALMLWDLAHSAGALAVDLNGTGVDLAVGCGYKYLNGGPGAPAFAFVARALQENFDQPLSGWLGHASPFAFETGYRPAPGIARLQCGTAPVLSMTALESGVDTLLLAEAAGGLPALRRKSLQLGDLFIERVAARCADHPLRLITPRAHEQRGSQVSYAIGDPQMGYAVIQALIARGVIGDFRAPDILRFGLAPAYLRATDVWDAVEHLGQVLDTGQWREARFMSRKAVT